MTTETKFKVGDAVTAKGGKKYVVLNINPDSQSVHVASPADAKVYEETFVNVGDLRATKSTPAVPATPPAAPQTPPAAPTGDPVVPSQDGE